MTDSGWALILQWIYCGDIRVILSAKRSGSGQRSHYNCEFALESLTELWIQGDYLIMSAFQSPDIHCSGNGVVIVGLESVD
jgi:hypothetical protein